MAVKLKPNKPNKPNKSNKSNDEKTKIDERKVAEFISKGSQTKKEITNNSEQSDHRMILRMPRWLLEKLDEKRLERIGTISRNSLILEYIEKCIRE